PTQKETSVDNSTFGFDHSYDDLMKKQNEFLDSQKKDSEQLKKDLEQQKKDFTQFQENAQKFFSQQSEQTPSDTVPFLKGIDLSLNFIVALLSALFGLAIIAMFFLGMGGKS
ncbi:hypothetical protein MX160_21105, partial [Bacillus cytotoxicus]